MTIIQYVSQWIHTYAGIVAVKNISFEKKQLMLYVTNVESILLLTSINFE